MQLAERHEAPAEQQRRCTHPLPQAPDAVEREPRAPRIAAASAHPNLGSPGAGAAGHDRRPGAAPRPPGPAGVAGLAALAAPEQRTPARRPLPVAADTCRPRPVRSGQRRPDAWPRSRNVCHTRTRPLPQPSGPRGRPDTRGRPYRGRRCGGRPPGMRRTLRPPRKPQSRPALGSSTVGSATPVNRSQVGAGQVDTSAQPGADTGRAVQTSAVPEQPDS
jgi:hypothetical protein